LPHLGLQGLRDMDHLTFFFHPQGKIQTGMKFSLGAFTSGFTADPRHGNQRADEQGFLVEELGQPGAGLALFGGKIATVTHKDLLSSDIYNYIR